MTRTRTLAVTLVAVASLLFAACGDDTDDGAGDDVSTDSAAVTDDTTAVADETIADDDETTDAGTVDDEASDEVAAGGVPDACSLVEPAEVEALIGAAEPVGETDTAIDGFAYSQCNWENDDGLFLVAVIEGAERYESHQDNLPGEPLAGVGDEALTAPGVSSETMGATGGRTISALVGGRTLVVALRVPGETTVELVQPIAATVADRL